MKKHLILSIGLLLSLEAISQDGPFSFNGKTTIFTGNALHWDASQDATTNLILSTWSDRYIKINGATFRQNGYLGIGTASPNVMLEVAGLGRFTGPNGFSIGGDGNQLRIQTSTDIPNHAFGFLNAGNSFEGIRVKQVSVGGNFADLYAAPLNGMIIEGNLGVGTNSPAFKLDVSGTLRTTSFISGRDYITVDNGNSGGSYRVALNGQSDGYVTGRDSYGQDKFLIGSNGNSYITGGNLGIGTTSPGNRLEVFGSTFNRVSAVVNADVQNGFQIKRTGSNATDWEIYNPAGNTDLRFYNAGQGDILTVKNNGNVGIGLSPSDRLQIGGSGKLNIRLGQWASLGETGSGIATVIGNNIKASTSTDNTMEFITTTGDGAKAIKMQYNEGISFHTYLGSVTMGGAFTGYERMRIDNNGNVAIGTTNPGTFKLAVEGKIGAREVNVTLASPWPDYVFSPNYKLPSLSELERYIKTNKHLPEVPTAEQVKENGLSLGEMNAILLKKVEELTMYLIEQNKSNIDLKQQVEELQVKVNKLETSNK